MQLHSAEHPYSELHVKVRARTRCRRAFSLRDADGSRTHLGRGCSSPPGRLAPASTKCGMWNAECGIENRLIPRSEFLIRHSGQWTAGELNPDFRYATPVSFPVGRAAPSEA